MSTCFGLLRIPNLWIQTEDVDSNGDYYEDHLEEPHDYYALDLDSDLEGASTNSSEESACDTSTLDISMDYT